MLPTRQGCALLLRLLVNLQKLLGNIFIKTIWTNLLAWKNGTVALLASVDSGDY
jgi:hypothetical protein